MRWWASGTTLGEAYQRSADAHDVASERNVESGAKEDHTNPSASAKRILACTELHCAAAIRRDIFDFLVQRLAPGHLTSPDRIISRAPGGIARKMLPSAR